MTPGTGFVAFLAVVLPATAALAEPSSVLFCGVQGGGDAQTRAMMADALTSVATGTLAVHLLDGWDSPGERWARDEVDLARACAREAAATGAEFAMLVQTAVVEGSFEVTFWIGDAGGNAAPVTYTEKLPPQRLALGRLQEALEALLQRVPGFVEVRLLPPGARMAVDGMPLAASVVGQESALLVAVLAPGSHDVEAIAQGFQPFAQSVTVVAGARATLEIALSPVAAASSPPPSPLSAEFPPSAAVPAGLTPTTPPPPPALDLQELAASATGEGSEEEEGVSQWWFWVTTVAAVGLVAGGAVSAVEMTDRFNALDDMRRTCFDEGSAGYPVEYEYSACDLSKDIDNQGRTYGALAGVLLAGAGLAAGAAFVLAFFTDWGGEEETGVGVGLTPLVGEGRSGISGAVLELGASF